MRYQNQTKFQIDGSGSNEEKALEVSDAASVAWSAVEPRNGRRYRPWRGMLWLAGCLILAGTLWWSGAPRPEAHTPTPFVAVSHAATAPAGRFTPIEQLRVGDRVAADNPEDGQPAPAQPTEVDPITWRKLVLHGQLIWQDGTIDDINVETLQPPEWIAAHDARVGNLVPLPLDLVEMGLPKGLKARVLENLPCPPIRPGPGRVVRTTVNHLHNRVVELTVEDRQGRTARIRPTAFHKFYSRTRHTWVSAEDIQSDEQIATLGGTVRLVRCRPIPGIHRVYNLTVEGEHVYHVTKLVVDGHNNCLDAGGPKRIPAPEKQIIDIAKRIARELGSDARRDFHDLKDRALGDRTIEEALGDAMSLYEDAGKEIPSWLIDRLR